MNNQIQNTPKQSFDLIGDIHGYADPLLRLLEVLGYQKSGETYHHPAGRKIVFAGDFVDRGPKIRETLHLVRSMIDSGDALAVMGNHEYNAVCFHTPDGKGDYLRSHTERNGKNVKQHEATLSAFAGLDREWDEWIDWFRDLPFFLDLGEVRMVHASWIPSAIQMLEKQSLADDQFLRASANPGTTEYAAIETTLKGLEIPLPEGNYFEDKQGLCRSQTRVKWWEDPVGQTYREVAFPYCETVSEEPIDPNTVHAWQPYSQSEPPVFFGHYWLPANQSSGPQAENVACLDYSVAKPGGKLAAYRWDGEPRLDARKFVTVPQTV